MLLKFKYFYYSVLKASTGSFFAANLAGISPAIIVSTTLIITKIIAPFIGKIAAFEIEARLFISKFIGIVNNIVTPIPISPAVIPIINVSALNTLVISFLEAPILRKIPISFVLSRSEIYVIIPILIDDTINDISTNAINI